MVVAIYIETDVKEKLKLRFNINLNWMTISTYIMTIPVLDRYQYLILNIHPKQE